MIVKLLFYYFYCPRVLGKKNEGEIHGCADFAGSRRARRGKSRIKASSSSSLSSSYFPHSSRVIYYCATIVNDVAGRAA